jgi:hypothetical protein
MGRAVYVYSMDVGSDDDPARVGGVVQSPKELDVGRLMSIVLQRDESIPAGTVPRDFLYTEWRLDGDGYQPHDGQ